jgi:hypothetical protein
MTLYLYRLLSPKVQLRYVVVLRGTYLAQRWEKERSISLYHLADKGRGFFVEVGFDEVTQVASALRSFIGNAPPKNRYPTDTG